MEHTEREIELKLKLGEESERSDEPKLSYARSLGLSFKIICVVQLFPRILPSICESDSAGPFMTRAWRDRSHPFDRHIT